MSLINPSNHAANYMAFSKLYALSQTTIYTLMLAVFFLSHWGIMHVIQFPEFRPDWSGYQNVMADILGGTFPDISIRPVGYILFVMPVFLIFDSYIAVIITQSLAMLAASLYLVRSSFKLNTIFGLVTGLGMIAILGRGITLLINNRVLTDSIYSTTIILLVAFLIRYFYIRQTRYAVLASISVGYLVLTKPAGHWAIITLIMFVLFIALKVKNKRHTVAAILPATAILGTLVCYNGLVSGNWTTNAYGAANISGATWFYWQPSDDYDPAINSMIMTVHKNAYNCEEWPDRCINNKDLEIIKNSWDPESLSNAYENLFGFWKRSWKFGLKDYIFENHEGNRRNDKVINANPVLYELSFDAIMNEPGTYFRTVLATLYRQYYHFFYDGFYYNQPQYEEQLSKLEVFKTRKWFKDDPHLAVGRVCCNFPSNEINDKIISLGKAHENYPTGIRLYKHYHQSIHMKLFAHRVAGSFFLIVMTLSGIILVASRLKHEGALLAFLITSGCFGAGLIVALVELGTVKYAAPTAFMQYISIGSAWLLLPRFKSLSRIKLE